MIFDARPFAGPVVGNRAEKNQNQKSMNEIWTTAPEVLKIVEQTFPGYKGNKIRVCACTGGGMRLDSSWQDGSRDLWALLDMATGRGIAIPENGTPFSNGGQIFTLDHLPANIALVQHITFCGNDHGIRIHVSPENLNRLALPAAVPVTQAEKIVLAYTRGRKSSYNGKNRQQMAEEDSGITLGQWEESKAACVAKGWLLKSGAITNDGRNVIGTTNPDYLKMPGFKRNDWERDGSEAA